MQFGVNVDFNFFFFELMVFDTEKDAIKILWKRGI